jgi:PEP-CTERM motif
MNRTPFRPAGKGAAQGGPIQKEKVMKKLLGLLLGAAFALNAGATPAGASAFVGTLGIAVGTLGTLPFTGAGSGTSTANNLTVPGGTFAGMVSVPVTGNPPITNIVVNIASNGAGAWTGDPLTGAMPIFGGAAVKGNLGGGPLTLVGVPFFTNHTPSSSAGNVGLGIGGSVLLTIGGNPNVYLNVFNTNWSEGMKTVTGLQYVYVYHAPSGMAASMFFNSTFLNGTAMYTGTDSRTPGGLGQVTLVSPTKVVTNLTGGLLILVTLGKLTLNFVPEPGTLLLLGSGVAGLAALGRRRMRRD